MPRYHVCVTVDASYTTEIEADSEAEAKEKAMEEAYSPSLCHQCSHKIEIGDPMEAVDAWLP